jgi:hypothetical protein
MAPAPMVDDREVFLAERFLFLGIQNHGLEELLVDQGGHEVGQDVFSRLGTR